VAFGELMLKFATSVDKDVFLSVSQSLNVNLDEIVWYLRQ